MSAKIAARDLLTKAEPLLKTKVSVLLKGAADFQATDGVEKALIVHNNALALKESLESITPEAVVSQPIT
jgi:hypothetical protein